MSLNTKHQAITIHWFFQTQSQNSRLYPTQLTMLPTSLHQRLWLKFLWICALYKYCNNNNYYHHSVALHSRVRHVFVGDSGVLQPPAQSDWPLSENQKVLYKALVGKRLFGSMSHTCLYSPATEHHRPLAGTHCAYPPRDGQAELTWVAVGWYSLHLPTEVRSKQTTQHILDCCIDAQ